MARKPTTPTTPFPSQGSADVTLTQQALNVVRQLLNSQGWAKGVQDIYIGGQLLSETLPSLDVSWVKTDKEISLMTDVERKLYVEQDKAWGEKPVALHLSANELDAVKRAYLHNIAELVKAGKLGPHPVLFEIAKAVGVKGDEEEIAG